MRSLCLLAAVAVLCLGCTTEPTGPQTPVKTPDAGEQQRPKYLGKPLDYWTQQATAVDKMEETGRIVEALTHALDADELALRVDAADALEVIGPQAKAAAPALAVQLDHVQPWVRTASMAALTAIGAPAVPALVDTFQNGPGNSPIRAAIVLGSIGPAAKDALPVLEKALPDMPGKRDRLTEILGQIDPQRAVASVVEPPPGDGPVAAAIPSQSVPIAIEGQMDWPGFHGPGRDSLCLETGLLQEWPEGGPKLLWQLDGLGDGYSMVSIADGKIFTMGDRTPEKRPLSQFAIAYDLATREELWATRVGLPYEDGPRCTPTVDGELLYVLGTEGDLLCLQAATGAVRWRKNLVEDFGGTMMSGWKYSESPLVDGDRLICTPGGEDAALVALDKLTGEVIWKSTVPNLGQQGKDGAAYSSAVVAEIEGVRQYVQLLGRGVVGVEAGTGRFLWGYNRIANSVANVTTPAVRGNYVFVTTSYKGGGALLKITPDGDVFRAEEAYYLDSRRFENHHGGVVMVGDYLYAGSGQNQGDPVCLELATGKILWKVLHQKAPARGSASVLYADGHLIFRYDRGPVALIEATPEGFRLKGRFQPIAGTGPAWSHPVIHDGRLYLRQNDLLLCYDVRAGG